jgi:hypothetical protein
MGVKTRTDGQTFSGSETYQRVGTGGANMDKNTLTTEEYIFFCREVEVRARKVFGAAGNGRSEVAALLALDLVQFVMDARHQAKMQQETAGGYDLATLKVDAAAPSNSETGWERLDDD